MSSDYERNRTMLGYTETRRGLIPHLAVVIEGFSLLAPVALTGGPEAWDNGGLRDPKINRDGRYLHALPGGGEVVGAMA